MRLRFPLPAPLCIKEVFHLSRHVRGLYSSLFFHQFRVLQSGVEQFGSSLGS
ncbi:hypothetical protein CFC21_075568 [Triticum aestivum]|uniref:Uncharacterized protein n=2 Tax=Triticum aestivum TaxID=4565 RepID=A0A3B6MJM1_WHEAT|nr:hypothetical protein CFC21_075568 [Triticum aestivum]